jgi:hypothetical protein
MSRPRQTAVSFPSRVRGSPQAHRHNLPPGTFSVRLLCFLTSLLSVASHSGAQPQAPHRDDVDSGLVAWYRFDGNAQDASSNNNHGFLRGFRPTADRHGSPASALLSVTPQDDVIFQPSSDFSFADSRALSLGLWCRFTPGQQDGGIKFGIGCRGTICRYFGVAIGVSGTTAWGWVHASECIINVRGVIPAEGGPWHHLMIVVDDQSLVLYVDGSPADRRSIYDMKWDTPMLTVCQLSGSTSNPHPQRIAVDDLRIYRRVLSAQEVMALVHRKSD